MTPEQEQEQRAEWHKIIGFAIQDASNTKRFSNSDLMDIQEIVTARLIKSGLMNTEEENKFNHAIHIFSCNDKDWVQPKHKKQKSNYFPNAESVDGRW